MDGPDLEEYRRCLQTVAEDLRPSVVGTTTSQQTEILQELLRSMTVERYSNLKESVENKIRQRAREIGK